MKELNFNKKSWHFFLANMNGSQQHKQSTDLCSYTRNALIGAFIAVLCTIIFAFSAYIVVNMLFALVFSIAYSAVIMTEAAFVGWMAAFCILMYLLLISVIEAASNRRMNRVERNFKSKPDGFIVNAYKGFKDKFCVKVNLNE
jgi:hypothetical protein